MFLGEYEYKIDPKGRVSIPPKFRGQFAEGIVLTKGVDKCITVYTPAVWKEVAEKVPVTPIARSKSRRLNRVLFASSFNMELDDQGRLVLPAALRQHAGIKEVLVIAGINNYLEIWSKELWEEEQARMEDEAWQIAEGMEIEP